MEDNFSLDALRRRIDNISDQTLSHVISDTMFQLTAIADERLKNWRTDIQAKKTARLSESEINGIEEFITEYLVGLHELVTGGYKSPVIDRRDSSILAVLLSSIERIQGQHLRLINALNGLKTRQNLLLAKNNNILNIIEQLIQSNDTCMRSLYIALNPILGGGILIRRRRKQRAVTYKKVTNRKKQRRNTKKQHRIK